jgi:CheY-like chemotaxis protein
MAKRILVIEDNEDVRENIVEILELDGYDVLNAPHGKAGVEMALEHLPDIILCDIMMPELDGFGVLKILNRNAKTHHIPFIFLTAKAEKADFRKGMGLGADDYITKPFNDTDLLEAVEMRLKKSENSKPAGGNREDQVRTFISKARAEEGLKELSENRETRRFAPKQSIYEQGGIPRYLYLITKGNVKCFQANDLGKELITHVFREGQFFGHLALVQNQPYIESAVAINDVEVQLIPKEDFQKLLFSNSDFSAQFIKMIANETLDIEQQLLDVAYGSVRKKVANALLTLATDTDLSNNLIVLDMSREDLSKVVGIAKETLIRTLSDFKSEGLIDLENNSIHVVDADGLRKMPM